MTVSLFCFQKKVCDGVNDCLNGFDETQCDVDQGFEKCDSLAECLWSTNSTKGVSFAIGEDIVLFENVPS